MGRDPGLPQSSSHWPWCDSPGRLAQRWAVVGREKPLLDPSWDPDPVQGQTRPGAVPWARGG